MTGNRLIPRPGSFKPFVQHRQTVLFQGLNLTLDCFFDIGHGLFSGFPLAVTPRQTGALSYPITILARMNNHLSHGNSPYVSDYAIAVEALG